MIGVLSTDSDVRAVQEFFQLFKTPWEFYVPLRFYDIVVITADEMPADLNASVVVLYNSRSIESDGDAPAFTPPKQSCQWLQWDGVEFPVYGDIAVFQLAWRPFIRRRGTSEIIGFEVSEASRQTMRIGYDLFQEVSLLLSKGQPPQNAHIPTLEIHISLLRSVMVNAGVPFVEIPPVPAGYDFMACLTHDVDFAGIRNHKFDHTMLGFVYRAFAGSLFDALRGRIVWSKCRRNWKAAFSLPLVYFGLQDDFWLEFDRYMRIEKGLGSTFFFIPFKNCPGTRASSSAPKRRAAKYDVSQIKEQVQQLIEHGCEVGLHGIDAWQNPQKAHVELTRIRDLTGRSEVGVRMHWLYFAEGSPKALEEAGFSYDSTFGYNDAVGFRGGTTQVFCPPTAEDLLELPMNVQDTAMFYPSRMNLSETEALDSCKQLIRFATTFGGALTVNWHTRSLSPERLWGDFYVRLLEEIQNHRVWFGTAREIVLWFRKRRALRFAEVEISENSFRVKIAGGAPNGDPAFLVRIHYPNVRSSTGPVPPNFAAGYSDSYWRGEKNVEGVMRRPSGSQLHESRL